MKHVYLASQSPQRKRLLKQCGVRFTVVKSRYKERNSRTLTPRQIAIKHARGKARGTSLKQGLVIGADTLVSQAGRLYGKPKNRRAAERMLKLFSGRTQFIYTGVALYDAAKDKLRSFVVCSSVTFHVISDHELQAYLATGEYRGKSGSFALQGKAAYLIKRVRGSHSNIVGLPVTELKRALKRF